MSRKILALSVVGFLIMGTGSAFAQFGAFKGLTGGGKAASGSASTSDLNGSREAAVTAYLASTQELSLSLQKAGEAFGVKQDVLEKLAAVNSLKEGNINSKNLDADRKSSEEAQAIILAKMKETTAPSVESKALMAESMVHLALGIQKEKDLVGTVQGLSTQAQAAVSSASPMEMMKVKDISATAVTLVQALPKDIKLSTSILAAYLEYAKAHNISSPSNASNLLKGE